MKAENQINRQKDISGRYIIILLMSIGFVLPVLNFMNSGSYVFVALLTILIVTSLCVFSSLLTKTVWIGFAAILAGLIVFFIIVSGQNSFVGMFMNSVYAIYLFMFFGHTAALPLYALSCVVVVSVPLTVLCFVLSQKKTDFYASLSICVSYVLIFWAYGCHDLLIYFFPSIPALITLYALNSNDNIKARSVIPTAVVLTVLAFLFTPAKGVIIPELEKAAQDIRRTIYDYLFFTEKRDTFSLLAEGYYPLGEDQLGGSVEPFDYPVMEVMTDRVVYLRGTTKDEYTGRKWNDTTGSRRFLYVSPAFYSIRDSIFDKKLPGGELANSSYMKETTITVKILSESSTTLFLPQRFRSLEMLSDSMVPYFNNASEVFITRHLLPGDAYRVSAPLMTAGETGLAIFLSGCAERVKGQTVNIDGRYISVPDHIQEQVRDLAVKVAGDYQTDYDRALALQSYLSHYFKYTLEPKPMRGKADFVTYFLLDAKEGYCTYFASAMTVLCRLIGLPSRYVEGYIAIPDSQGTAHVTGLNAHAWTEVFFDGFGWLTFDATPARTYGNPNQSEQEPQDDQTEDDNTQPNTADSDVSAQDDDLNTDLDPDTSDTEPSVDDPSQQDDTNKASSDEQTHFWWLWLFLMIIMFTAYRLYRAFPANRAKHTRTQGGVFDVWIQAVYDIVYIKKFVKMPGETLSAHAQRVDNKNVFNTALMPLAQVLSYLIYSTHLVETGFIKLAQNTYMSFMQSLTFTDKCRFVIMRMFIPVRYHHYLKRLG